MPHPSRLPVFCSGVRCCLRWSVAVGTLLLPVHGAIAENRTYRPYGTVSSSSTRLSGSIARKPAPQAEFDSACKVYSNGDIRGCVKLVDAILKKQPKDPSAHFLKANCLVKLKKLPEAVHEYALVEHYSPGSKLAAQAKGAGAHLVSLQLKSSVATDTNAEKRWKHLPPGTIELIRKQASQASLRATEMGQTEADDEVKKASYQARSEQERAERMIQTSQQRGDAAGVSGYEAELIRNRAQANAEQLKRNGDIRASWKEQDAKDKAENLQQQAEELEAQLINDRPSRFGTVKLNPVGTNLYTRNYSSTRAPVKPLDAQTLTLPDVGSRHTSASMSSSQQFKTTQGVGAKGKYTETKVKGQVVPRY